MSTDEQVVLWLKNEFPTAMIHKGVVTISNSRFSFDRFVHLYKSAYDKGLHDGIEDCESKSDHF